MLLRKLVAGLAPLLLCLLTCAFFHWLDNRMPGGGFLPFALKGFVLGLCVGLLLPVAGITARTNGLARWLYVAAGILSLLLFYQYLEASRIVHWPILESLITINSQVIFAESTVVGFLLLTAFLNRNR